MAGHGFPSKFHTKKIKYSAECHFLYFAVFFIAKTAVSVCFQPAEPAVFCAEAAKMQKAGSKRTCLLQTK